MSIDNETHYPVEYHSDPKPETVSDGEIKFGNLGFYEFPGVSVCIPIIIRRDDEILAAIHANPKWDYKKLESQVKKMMKKSWLPLMKHNMTLEFAEKIYPDPSLLSPNDNDNSFTIDHPNRQALLEWFKQNPLKISIVRHPIFKTDIIDHIGYKKETGFKKLKIVF